MNKPKISVIVPVWNTEKYLEKCIHSLLSQSYPNLEILLIDDASTDSSKKILEKYKKENNIKIHYNKEHKGTAYSRNYALSIATGDYIGCIDSDDYIPEDYYDTLMTTMKKENADLVVCDMLHIYENQDLADLKIPGCNGEITKINLINNSMAASGCNKLFHKSLLIDYPYPEGKMNEDLAAVIPAIVKAKKIAYVPDLCYNYIQHKNSTQNQEFSEKRFDIFNTLKITLQRIQGCENFEAYKEALTYNQLIALFIYVFPKIKSYKKRYQYIKKFGKLGKEYNFTQNHCYWQFLSHETKKNQLYYRTMFYLERKGYYFLCNTIIESAQIYKNTFRKNVTKPITLDMLIKCAKKQQNKHSSNVKVSVVIPNYNYEKFLYERVYSILNQTAKIHELIILDDVSKDNSRQMIDELVEKLSPYIAISKNYNKTNSGSPFKQWQKGFNLATGNYVWIAEADDYCDKKMLASVIKLIKKEENIRIAYVDTAYINGEGKKILNSIKPEIDILKTGHWDTSFINDGKKEFHDYAYLNCTIANVSSVLFKKDDYQEFFKLSGQYRQAGDWLFYVNVMNLGKIAFVNKPLNYYRVHGNNVTSTTKKAKHLKELEQIHDYFDQTYGLNKKQKKEIEKRYAFLRKVWNIEK